MRSYQQARTMRRQMKPERGKICSFFWAPQSSPLLNVPSWPWQEAPETPLNAILLIPSWRPHGYGLGQSIRGKKWAAGFHCVWGVAVVRSGHLHARGFEPSASRRKRPTQLATNLASTMEKTSNRENKPPMCARGVAVAMVPHSSFRAIDPQ